MTTLLLFSLPWGYLIAGIFLLLAIILFIVAIFMKDTGENYDEELETRRYNKKKEKEDYEASYEDTFDRYQNVTENEEPEDTLQDMIAETSEDLAETRMFTPIVDIPEPEPFEELTAAETVEEVAEEEVPEDVFTAPVASFADFAEPEEAAEETVEEDEEIPEESAIEPEEIVEEIPVAEPVKKARVAAPVDEEDEFEEIRLRKKRFPREEEKDEMEVPKPVAKQKSGMSFAEEVRRLIEEEERNKK